MAKHIILTNTALDPADVVLVTRTALPQALTGLDAGTYTLRDTSAPVSGTVTAAVVTPDPEPEPVEPGITAQDDFAGAAGGTLLSALSADQGGWTIPAASQGTPLVRPSGDILIGPTSAEGAANNSFWIGQIDARPVSAGVFVELDLRVLGSFTASQLAAYAAVGIGEGTSRTMFLAGYNGAQLRILRLVNNSATLLGNVSKTLVADSDHTLRLECETGVQRLYLDGALQVTTAQADLSGMGMGLGLAMQVGTARFSDTSGPGVRAIRVGVL